VLPERALVLFRAFYRVNSLALNVGVVLQCCRLAVKNNCSPESAVDSHLQYGTGVERFSNPAARLERRTHAP